MSFDILEFGNYLNTLFSNTVLFISASQAKLLIFIPFRIFFCSFSYLSNLLSYFDFFLFRADVTWLFSLLFSIDGDSTTSLSNLETQDTSLQTLFWWLCDWRQISCLLTCEYLWASLVLHTCLSNEKNWFLFLASEKHVFLYSSTAFWRSSPWEKIRYFGGLLPESLNWPFVEVPF